MLRNKIMIFLLSVSLVLGMTVGPWDVGLAEEIEEETLTEIENSSEGGEINSEEDYEENLDEDSENTSTIDNAGDKARVDAQYDLCIWNDVNRTVILGPYKGNENHVQVPGRVYVDGQYYKVYIGNDTFFKAPRATGIFTLIVGTAEEPVEYRGSDLSNAFSGLANAQVIDLSNMTVGSVTSMSGMFQDDVKLMEIYLPNEINTAGLTNANYMFYNCSSLLEVDLSDIRFNATGSPLGVFGNTTNLQRVTVASGNTAKVSLDGHNFRDQATGTYYTSFPTGNTGPVTLESTDAPTPEAPTPEGNTSVIGFSATQSGTNSIYVKWDAMSQGVSKYLIECIGSNNTSTSYEINESTGIPNSSYTINNLTQGVTYNVRMCAYDYNGKKGPYTNYSSVTLSQNVPSSGTDITGFNAIATDGNTINVTWNPIYQGVAKYTIQIIGSDGYHNVIDINENGSLPNSSYIIRNLTPGINYFVQMWAINYNGEVGNSTSFLKVTTPEVFSHNHTFSSEWKSDEYYHWHPASCNNDDTCKSAVDSQDVHQFGAYVVVEAATATKEGLERRSCAVCGYVQTRRIAADVSKDSIIKELGDMGEGQKLSIDYSKYSTLNKEVLDELKGKNKEIELKTSSGVIWSFKGNDIIRNTADVDLTVGISMLLYYNGPDKNFIVNNSANRNIVVLRFADNGALPGKANVKIPIDASLSNYLGQNGITAYYVSEGTGELQQIKGNLSVVSNYLEFYIYHCSSYILAGRVVGNNGSFSPGSGSGSGISSSGNSSWRPNYTPNPGTSGTGLPGGSVSNAGINNNGTSNTTMPNSSGTSNANASNSNTSNNTPNTNVSNVSIPNNSVVGPLETSNATLQNENKPDGIVALSEKDAPLENQINDIVVNQTNSDNRDYDSKVATGLPSRSSNDASETFENSIPKTGDDVRVYFWLVMMITGVVLLGITLVRYRKDSLAAGTIGNSNDFVSAREAKAFLDSYFR